MRAVSLEDVRASLARHQARSLAEPLAARAAVSIVLREAEPGLELLFIHRSEDPHDPWSGHMAFPGGRAEPGDADLRETAVRETAEEIGVDLEAGGEWLGALDEVRAMARGRPLDLAITPHVFALRASVELRPNHEVGDTVWIGLDGLLGAAWRSTLDWRHDGNLLRLPCFRYRDKVIWGLTFRMFENLAERLSGTPAAALAP